MVAQNGSLVLLKIARGTTPEKYVTIGGMRATRFLLNNQLIDASHKESGKWRSLLTGAGISSLSITGSGVFTNAESEVLLRQNAFNNSATTFCLFFGNGDILSGLFVVSAYERQGNFAEEECYSITLESAGEIKYVG